MEAATVLGQAPEGAWTASLTPSKVSSDEQLVAMIRAGHPTAFEIVYDRHSRAILAYCKRLLGDLHEAEDAVQHTFLAAYRALMAGKEDIQLQPWLFTIARNRCYSILRARREVAVADIHEGVSDGPAAVVQRREELRDVVLDVSRLPEDQRQALVMSELGDLSHDEIAHALEVPREKVKALVFQARESLVATRAARETDCAEIRLQLRTVHGPALRRGNLRRHLSECTGCQQYRRELRGQRLRVAGIIPIAPWLTRLRRLFTGGRRGTLASSALKAAAVKPLLVGAIAVLGAAGAVGAVQALGGSGHAHHAGAQRSASGGGTGGQAAHAASTRHVAAGAATASGTLTRSSGKARRLHGAKASRPRPTAGRGSAKGPSPSGAGGGASASGAKSVSTGAGGSTVTGAAGGPSGGVVSGAVSGSSHVLQSTNVAGAVKQGVAATRGAVTGAAGAATGAAGAASGSAGGTAGTAGRVVSGATGATTGAAGAVTGAATGAAGAVTNHGVTTPSVP